MDQSFCSKGQAWKNSYIKKSAPEDTPGLRIYSEVNKLPTVLNGLGIALISTSQGIMTDKNARKNNFAGEVIAYV